MNVSRFYNILNLIQRSYSVTNWICILNTIHNFSWFMHLIYWLELVSSNMFHCNFIMYGQLCIVSRPVYFTEFTLLWCTFSKRGGQKPTPLNYKLRSWIYYTTKQEEQLQTLFLSFFHVFQCMNANQIFL